MFKFIVLFEFGVGFVVLKKEVIVEDFEKLFDFIFLFMWEILKDGDDNFVLEVLRSLVFEGEGDGEFVYLVLFFVLGVEC